MAQGKVSHCSTLSSNLSFVSFDATGLSGGTNTAQSFILNGVTSVVRTCTPGSMTLINERAFPILAGEYDGIRRAHVAGVEWENGRIVAYSHDSFYVSNLPIGDIDAGNIQLLINSIDWVRKDGGTKIGVYAEERTKEIISEHGFDMYILSPNNLNNLTILEQFDALVVTYFSDDLKLANIRTYVRNGGGLVIGATAWTSAGNEKESYWGNAVLKETGIFYIQFYSLGNGGCDVYNNGDCSYIPSLEYLEDTSAFQVWKDLSEFNWSRIIPMVKLTQMIGIMSDRLQYGPSNATLNAEVGLIGQRVLRQIPSIVPTERDPVIQKDEMDYIITHKQWTVFLNFFGMTDNIPPHPAATSFPGVALMKNETETRVKAFVEIDGRTGWHSTGLYAEPGEEIKITALDVDETITDLGVQIGMHSDNLEALASWIRCPYIIFRNQMENGTATGGIPSPTYFLGETKLSQWQNEIRNYPAPWGELIGKNLILSLQTSLLSQIYNPEEVIQFWDRVMDTIADLAGIPYERDPPARFVADVQISAGSMHSGYPIMYYLGSQIYCANLTEMKVNPWKIWGFLHELGHNHQQSDWTFKGTGEVTNNLFALYVLHTLFDCPTNSTPSYSDASVAKRLKAYVDNGKQFSQWQSNYDLAFDTYVQLQEAFGWSTYKTIFANYRKLAQDERPKTDAEKIDLWVVMFSQVVEENLAEFFISWGFPISSEVGELLKYLPPTNLRIPAVL
ncbi:TRPM8 channel-associated factor like [Pseudolycoriella hygida]|uniref:TRPM8 channel-associated factor like n=1 Tax=Pseudolycoriella hygida TaxID=35572 RepID=A0A9Q0N158_9DIPT|nr:TRPM8 channel-associated factor like [Pseudolycoriella hygida]